ncbi:meiotic nuclear division protein 1 homolog [Topomyia yanbarensis]|uniref:meiotic nuclear division protein 1 homolog n=1 Tax=Topomyia yanbarensis TaxID=2498891 RepID=UPI00273B241E|nr:meiotic nuclear division protein 1 homolog [Topomyia yanbarensis]
MSKRQKTISADEKKALLLEIFHETKEFYQLKDLEKIAVRSKGLKEQTVKDILSSLVDAGSVESDRIGTSHYYWSFPNKKRRSKQNELEELQEKLRTAESRLEILRTDLKNKKASQEESSSSIAIFEKLRNLKSKEAALQNALKPLLNNDKKKLENMRMSLPKLHEAANRWTDNIFSIKSWCKSRFNIEEKLIDKQFQIPADLDYLD